MRRTFATLLLFLTLSAPSTAGAVEIAKRFGLGYQLTLAGAQGLCARYQASASIGLELIAGLGAVFADDDEFGKFDAVYLAGGFSFVLASDDRGMITLGTRVNMGTSFDRRSGRDGTPPERVTDIAFEVPLTIEYFVTPHFALRTGVGLVFAILHEELRVLGTNDELDERDVDSPDRPGGSSVGLGTGSVLANAGFTVWF